MDTRERDNDLATRFEAHRGHLRNLAFRMLGSASEAEDAVQEGWLRLHRTDAGEIDNLAAWLTRVVSRICLDLLRARAARREELVGAVVEQVAGQPDPETEAVLVDSVGRALLVVLDTLTPDERVAFVLHDMFAVPFDQLAPIVDRSVVTTKKLASRARTRVRGTPARPAAQLAGHRKVVDAFLAAARGGDLTGLLAVLAPDVVRRADAAVLRPGGIAVVHGARAVLEEMAVAFLPMSPVAAPALVNGRVGLVVAPQGRLRLAVALTIAGGRITAFDVIADPARLAAVELAVLDRSPS